jgi:hypothetical protein
MMMLAGNANFNVGIRPNIIRQFGGRNKKLALKNNNLNWYKFLKPSFQCIAVELFPLPPAVVAQKPKLNWVLLFQLYARQFRELFGRAILNSEIIIQ